MPNYSIPVITIDGPTASGKGTVASLLAQHLGFHHLDSGALYRLTALSVLRSHIPMDDECAITQIAQHLPCHFDAGNVYLEQENVSQLIRSEKVSHLASRIAAYPRVRLALMTRQRRFRHAPGLVADGRDMGTIIFPAAILKIFLTATLHARAQRRYHQLMEKGFSVSLPDLLKDLAARDTRDTHRDIAPLKPAKDAMLLDTSDITANEAVNQVLRWYITVRAAIGHAH